MEYHLRDESVREHVQNIIKSLSTKDDWVITVSPFKKGRSNPQNRLYWAWVRIISRECGYSDDDMHEILKSRFLGMQVIEYKTKGKTEQLVVPKSTAKLSKSEFTEYLEKVMVLGHKMGVNLPT